MAGTWKFVLGAMIGAMMGLAGCDSSSSPTDGVDAGSGGGTGEGADSGTSGALTCDDINCGAGACVDDGSGPTCVCGDNYAAPDCATCACDTCADGYTGDACDVCGVGYVPSIQIGICEVGLSVKTGLELWLDADDYETMDVTFQGGYRVAEWADKVDGSPVFANDTAEARPTWVGDGINGSSVLKFDGTDDALSALAFEGLTAKDAYTIFIAGYSTADDNGCFLEGSNGDERGLRARSLVSNRLVFSHDGDFGGLANQDVLTSTAATLPVSRESAQVMGFIRSGTDDVHGIRVDGAHEELLDSPGGVAFTGALDLEIGNCPTDPGFLNGYIGEVLVYSRALSAEELEAVETYLRLKWGI